MKIYQRFILAALISGGLASQAVSAPAGKSQTAQGIWVSVNTAGSYAIANEVTYKFNKAAAASYFTNLWDGVAPHRNDPNGVSAANLALVVVPNAPAPLSAKLDDGTPGKNDVVGSNQCNFLDGLALHGDTYTQAVDVAVPNTSNKKVTFTFTYVIAPTVVSAPALTAWDNLGSTTGDTAEISFSGKIAGESVVSSKQHPLKYSFSIENQTVDGPVNRVQNLKLTILDSSANVVSVTDLASSVVKAGMQTFQEFAYASNAGSNGNTILLMNGDARTILNTDSFPGNDNGGADGSALAYAQIPALTVNLAAGTYSFILTGVVKGNSADSTGLDQPITITESVTIIHPGCGQ